MEPKQEDQQPTLNSQDAEIKEEITAASEDEQSSVLQSGAVFTEVTPSDTEQQKFQPVQASNVTKMSERDIEEALEENAPTASRQTMVIGLKESAESKKSDQTLVTGDQYVERKAQSMPTYTTNSQQDKSTKTYRILKLVFITVTILLLAAVGYGAYILLVKA